jgi:tetratricopeptide (TPR) repeat protein
VPEAVDAAIAKALAAKVEDRWARSAEFAGAMGLGEARRTSSLGDWIRRPAHRRWMVVGGVILALGALTFSWGDDDSPAWASTVVPARHAATTSDAARAYAAARTALAAGREQEALRGFDDAVRRAPGFAEAALWRAQVAQWFPEPNAERWKEYAKTLAGAASLRGGDSLHAVGLVALANGRYVESCDAFSSLVRADSSSFVGWFGLGECSRLDERVIPDETSPSRWRFRAQWSDAQRAYRRAIELSPTGLPMPMFERALAVSQIRAEALRRGMDSMGTSRFSGFPRLVGGRVSYAAFPLAELMSGASFVLDSTFSDALDQERQYQFEIAESQSLRDSVSSRPHEVLAEILELRGQVNTGDGLGRSAERSLARAKALAPTDARVRLSATEARLLLKAGRYAEARRLADSVATRAVARTAADARWLAGLATISGLEKQASRFLAQSLSTEERQRSEFGAPLSPELVTALADLTVSVDFGRCDSTVTAGFRNVAFLVESQVDAAKITEMKRSVLSNLLARSLPCYRSVGADLPLEEPSWLPELARRALRSDAQGVARELDRIRDVRSAGRTAYVTFDAVLLEAWAMATVGDSVGATAHLDRAFAALPAATPGVMRDVAQPAALVRSMTLRARLAASAGDHASETRWRGYAKSLWT